MLTHGPITISRRKATGYRRTYTGTIQVCCHEVDYWYDITGVRLGSLDHLSLEEEAEERARTCLNEECSSGELNCVVRGEEEVSGWWTIHRD